MGGTETILVIEDEENIRSVLRSIFEHCGYTVLEGGDGEEGLEVFRRERERIALVLLDLSLPRMSGQKVLTNLRALKPQIKVVIFTGQVEDDAELTGVQAFIHKPIRMDVLAREVREVLDA